MRLQGFGHTSGGLVYSIKNVVSKDCALALRLQF